MPFSEVHAALQAPPPPSAIATNVQLLLHVMLMVYVRHYITGATRATAHAQRTAVNAVLWVRELLAAPQVLRTHLALNRFVNGRLRLVRQKENVTWDDRSRLLFRNAACWVRFAVSLMLPGASRRQVM